MASCLGDVHIWSVRNQAIIHDEDIGCFSYHEKSEAVSQEHPYIDEKAAYTEGRNVTWAPRNKRPDKLRDTLRDVEELLANHRCLKSKWLSRRLLQLILSNGVVVSLVVSIHTGDVDRIFIDKSLVGKLSSDMPSDALLTESYIAFVYADKSKMDYFYFIRRPAGDRKIDKISSYEPKLMHLDLPGPVNRRLDRQLVCNLNTDLIACWWPSAIGEAQPWSPMASDKEKSNLVLLIAIGSKFQIVTYAKTDCDPIGVVFSLLQPHQLLTIEQWTGSGGDININNSVYECNRSKVHKMSVTTVALKNPVTCYDRNLTEDKVLLGCTDGTIVLYDEYKKLTHVTSANVIPYKIRWHPSGTIATVTNSRGEIQLFDLALSPLLYQHVSENTVTVKTLPTARYLRSASPVRAMQWSPLVDQPENKMAECNDSLFMIFERGPMLMLQLYLGVLTNGILSPLALVNEYIKNRQIEQAIGILRSLNWNLEGQTCYACLCAIINHLLRASLNAEREGQLETVLGTFYAPVRPLLEVTVLEYRDPISRFARRFFHHLLRFSRFEKAFLLAVDIGAKDLFMDIHYIAKDKGEMSLAEAALRKAQQIDTDSLVNECVDGEEFTDGSEESFTDSEEDYEDTATGAPPPRPPKPTVPHKYSKPAPQLPQHQQIGGHGELTGLRGPHSSAFRSVSMPTMLPWQPRYVDMSEGVVRDLESELAAELVDEYTEALMEQPVPSHNHANSPDHSSMSGQDNRSTASVKVIHFGVV